jgi:hypothetical protein
MYKFSSRSAMLHEGILQVTSSTILVLLVTGAEARKLQGSKQQMPCEIYNMAALITVSVASSETP